MKVEDSDDGTSTAAHLNLLSKPVTDAKANATSVNSGDLHLKVIGENTLLSSLNGGAGVAAGQFTITDSQGVKATVDLRSSSIKTVGDAVRAINRLGLSTKAELNATGDGILLRDTAGGGGKLTVSEVGSGTTAHDLGLRRDPTADSTGQQTINGTTTYKIDIWAADTLQNVKTQINQLNAGFSAGVVNDGSVQPFRLSLTSGRTGKAGALVIDTSGANFSFGETAKAQDSLLVLGPQSAAATATLATSSSNTFTNLISGVTLNVKQGTGQTVSVTVDSTSTNLTASVKTFVDNYNKFRDKLGEVTKYDTSQNQGAVLTGDSTVLRFDTDLSGLLSRQFVGAGKIQSLATVGVTFTQDGHLQYDDSVLTQAVASDPQAVKDFFTTKDTGFSAKLHAMIEQLSGTNNSAVSARLTSLEATIASNQTRIDRLNASLDAQRAILESQFYNMETAISQLQSSQQTLSSLNWMLNYNYSNSSSSSSGSSK
jgi:flagellar hook-associated protein 2